MKASSTRTSSPQCGTWVHVTVLLALLSGGARASEDHCAAIKGGSDALESYDAGRRINYIQRRLNDDAYRVRIHTWTFAGTYSGLIVFNGTRLLLSTKHGDVIDNAVGTAGSAFGLLVLSIMPPAVLRDQHKLGRIVARFPTEDHCAVLAEAESIFLKDAASEAFGRGPLTHIGNFVVNSALTFLVGAYFHHWATAAIIGPVAIAAGEFQGLTVRTRIVQGLEHYRRGELDYHPSREHLSWSVAPDMGRDITNRQMFGMRLAGSF